MASTRAKRPSSAARRAPKKKEEEEPGSPDQAQEEFEEDVLNMALHLGLDVQSHPELLWIAGEAYDAPLPEYWTEHFDEEGNVYFFNQSTDDVSRDHPLDDYYRELYRLFRETPGLPEAEARRAAAGVLQRKGVAAAGPGPGGDGAAGGGVAPTQDQFNHSIHGAVSELREALSLSEKQRGETEAKLLEMATALQQSQNADAKIQQAAKEAAMDVLKQRLDAAEKAATEAKAAVEGERMKNELLLMETQYQGQIKDLEAKLSRAMSSRAEAKLAYKEEKKKAELVMKRAMETVAAAGASASSSESKRISELQQQLMAKEIELAEAVSALEVEKERAKLQLKHHRDLDAVLGEVKEGTTTVQEKLDGLQSNVAQQAKLEVDAQAVRAAEAAAAAREGALRDEIAALQGRLAGARGEGEARFAQREQELADEVARQKDRARKVELQHETELLRLRQRSHLDAASLARLRAAGDELRSVREFARTVARDAQQLRAVSADQLGQAAAVVARLNAEAAREAGKQRELADAIAACAQQMAPLIAEKRKLFNEMMRLKGNIRVFCRVRPMSQRELEAGGVEAVAFPTDCGQRMIELSSRLDHAVKKTYEYDRVFNGGATQEEVFEDVQPLIQSVMDGLNVCVFAYGQTGSGKTHTMEGYDGNRGVTYRSFEELFKLAGQTSGVYAYTFRVNMIEIYNETIVDLFMRKGTDSVKHDVKVEADGSVHIAGLSDREVRTPDEFVKVLLSGSRNRSVGATKMNDRSSRSHLVMMIKVAMRDRATDRVTHSKLSLVDLAGSERLKKSEVEGERLKESLNINKSLSALGDVIASLTSSKGHVPYRNSKLTHVLADSLGNDCKTLLFVNCSPAMENAQESGCSLMFASRARNVDLSSNGNTAASKKWKEAAALAEKVSKDKKRELEAVQEGLEEAQDKIAELQAAKKALKSDMKSASKSDASEIKALKAEVKELKAEAKLQKKDARNLEKGLKDERQQKAKLEDELERARGEVQAARGAAAPPAEAGLKDRVYKLEGDLKKKAKEVQALTEKLQAKEAAPKAAPGGGSPAETAKLRQQVSALTDINKQLLDKCKKAKEDKKALEEQLQAERAAGGAGTPPAPPRTGRSTLLAGGRPGSSGRPTSRGGAAEKVARMQAMYGGKR